MQKRLAANDNVPGGPVVNRQGPMRIIENRCKARDEISGDRGGGYAEENVASRSRLEAGERAGRRALDLRPSKARD